MAKSGVHKFIDLYFDKARLIYPQTFLSDENLAHILQSCEDEDQLGSLFYFLSKTECAFRW